MPFHFSSSSFLGVKKKKKVEEKQELKKVEGKEKQESEGRYEMHFQL